MRRERVERGGEGRREDEWRGEGKDRRREVKLLESNQNHSNPGPINQLCL